MRVVAATSSLCYLVKIRQIDLLPKLFSRILVPEAVTQDLRHPGAGPAVHHWISDPPSWLETQAAGEPTAADLRTLHRGEGEAIWLAETQHVDWFIIDEHSP